MSNFEFTPFAAANVKVELEEWDNNVNVDDDEESFLNFNKNLVDTTISKIGNCDERTEIHKDQNISVQAGLADTCDTDMEEEESVNMYIKSEPEEISSNIDYLGHPMNNIDQEGENVDDGEAHANIYDKLCAGDINSATEEKPFECETCGKTFSLKAYLNKHKLCHTVETPCKCETCGKPFRNSRYLTKHMRCHKTDKSYPCETCGKIFFRIDNLKQHSRIHLTGTERPSFDCELCEKSYVTLRRLNEHMIFHTGAHLYKCETCGKGFGGSDSLARHKLCHLEENDKFKCEMCGKSFARSYNFNTHLRLHSGEKPFVCDVCGKSYVSKNRLTRHKDKTCVPHQNRLASVMGIELNQTTPTPSSSSTGLDLTLTTN